MNSHQDVAYNATTSVIRQASPGVVLQKFVRLRIHCNRSLRCSVNGGNLDRVLPSDLPDMHVSISSQQSGVKIREP
jgi:hypothetical protein